ncbi:MAG: GTPase [Saonia sp.]
MEHQNPEKLLFVYNADSGLHNALLDSAHKILSPGTYDCKLCDITFGAFAEKRRWKKFREESRMKMEFLHKDEFSKQYASKFGHKFEFPIVLASSSNGLDVFIRPEEFKSLENTEDLIQLIQERSL